MADFPLLVTQRLILREFKAADAAAVFDIFSRSAVTRYHNLDVMRTMREAQELVERCAGLWSQGIGVRWAIALKERPDTAIGSCGWYNLNRSFRSLEIGYDLHPTHWRKGIMTEALTTLIGYCFGDAFLFKLNRIEALTYVQHVASVGLLWKLGFQEEGIRRQYSYWKNQFHDLRSFSLLRSDWETMQKLRSAYAAQTDLRLPGDEPQRGDKSSTPGRQYPRLGGWIV